MTGVSTDGAHSCVASEWWDGLNFDYVVVSALDHSYEASLRFRLFSLLFCRGLMVF